MTLKGSYKNNVVYSVGDVVMYTDNVVYHLQKPAKAGTPCTNTLYWERYDLVETVKLILDAISISGDNVTSKTANNLTTTASGKILDARQGKALKDRAASEIQCVAFVRSHNNDLKGQKVTAKEMMSVADLEKITGFTYFPGVPNAPKTTFNKADWGVN